MSGPCTLEYLLIQGVLLGAQATLDAARDIGRARDVAIRDAADRIADTRRMREEARAGLRHLAARARELEAGLERLRTLAAALAGREGEAAAPLEIDLPARPAALDDHALADYALTLERALATGREQLAAVASAMAGRQTGSPDPEGFGRLAQPRSLDDLLDAYLAEGRSVRRAADIAARRARMERLLAPLATGAAVAVLPGEIGALLAELAEPGETQRVQAVELELQRLVARERAKREAQARAQTQARELLALLDECTADDSATNAMRQTLELVASGLVDLTPDIEARARILIDALRAAEAERLRAAAAAVLEGTLTDLGFVVEPISHTLFLDGGVAHFSRPQWGEYAVRLRVSPSEGTINFNVVRESDAAPADPVSARIRDMRAEATWCEHIPQLSETLEARGIRLDVKRRLGAGEAPVQLVPAGALAGLPRAANRGTPAVPLADQVIPSSDPK